uniref:Uncharacterized protein n=1 Tax=Cacopsylla melanoneura TaxID=428564 RepID=A0A8D8SLR0_9HEMI
MMGCDGKCFSTNICTGPTFSFTSFLYLMIFLLKRFLGVFKNEENYMYADVGNKKVTEERLGKRSGRRKKKKKRKITKLLVSHNLNVGNVFYYLYLFLSYKKHTQF